jgi:histone acetyltransferase (RNA polymerase elongator complex component)
MKKVTVPFFISHQGCPHTCAFCDQRIISGSSGELPTAEAIHAKIRTWRQSAGDRPVEVAFFGGTFTALAVSDQDRLLQPLQQMLATGEITSIRISTRPDAVDSAIVQRLAHLGVRTIEIGVQSMDDRVLEGSNRGHNAAASETALRCVKAEGLSAGAQLMPGLPGDSAARSISSLKKVIAAGADFIRIYPVVVLRGTELARRFAAGEYCPMGLEAGVQLCKVMLHESLKAGVDVIRIGLQADEGLTDTAVLAGCWHPALGQLTRSELYFDLLGKLLTDLPGGSPCTIRCHPSRVSDVAGLGRINLERIGERGVSAAIVPDISLLKEEITVNCFNQSIKGNIVSDLHYTIHEE